MEIYVNSLQIILSEVEIIIIIVVFVESFSWLVTELP